MADRMNWDQYFMGIAMQVRTRSTCDRAMVGCVLAKDNSILTTGYNGSPSGLAHCDDEGHLMVDGHCVRTVHAEMNAVIQAAKHGVSTEGATCYVTHFPCLLCTKILINSGIRRIVYRDDYRVDPLALDMLKSAMIELQKV